MGSGPEALGVGSTKLRQRRVRRTAENQAYTLGGWTSQVGVSKDDTPGWGGGNRAQSLAGCPLAGSQSS